MYAYLQQNEAIPLIARSVRETIDIFGRRKIELLLEDKRKAEIFVTERIPLGKKFYFFPVENNPRPVNPPLLPVKKWNE